MHYLPFIPHINKDGRQPNMARKAKPDWGLKRYDVFRAYTSNSRYRWKLNRIASIAQNDALFLCK